MTTSVDVVVAGGGPAGAAAAFRLAASGCCVCVVGGSTKRSMPAGETLPPQIRWQLASLGVPDGELARAAIDSYGIESSWGGRQRFHSHLVDADGNGWHTNRRTFASSLLHAAHGAGSQVFPRGAVTAISRTRNTWAVTVREETRHREFRCRFLVDATGRSARLAGRLGGERRRLDALCGVSAVVKRWAMPQTLSVESTEYGWWYAAPFSADEAIVCLMSDVDILRKIGAHDCKGWRELWLKTLLGRGMTMSQLDPIQLRVSPCESSILTTIRGHEWVAIGDAAAVFDPLASAGVIKAIYDGRVVGDAIQDYLSNGSEMHLRGHSDRTASEFQRYLIGRQAQYGLERRWPHAPFWERRQHK